MTIVMTPPPAARDAARGGDGKITPELVFATALELIDRTGPTPCRCAASGLRLTETR